MALTENPELLFVATEDKLHQDYRRSAMVESHKLVQKLRTAGFAAVISGAGPTVLVLATSNVSGEVADIASDKFEVHPLGVSKQGAHQVAMDS